MHYQGGWGLFIFYAKVVHLLAVSFLLLLFLLVFLVVATERPFSILVSLPLAAGFLFWYVVPGIYFIWVYDCGDDWFIKNLVDCVQDATSFLLVTIAFSFFACVLFSRTKPFLGLIKPKFLDLNILPLLTATIVCFALSVSIKIADIGAERLVSVLLLQQAAREGQDFSNISSGPLQSIMTFFDIITVFLSLVCVSSLIIKPKLSLLAVFLVSCPILVLYLFSGTRSLPMLLLVTGGLAFAVRSACLNRSGRRGGVGKNILNTAIGAACGWLFLGVAAVRFSDDPSLADSFIEQSLFVHNDMFRELVYAMASDGVFSRDPVGLLFTPFYFLFPRFLGFDKSIPSYLEDFNFHRARIDLVTGQGNVFPGILADFYINFGGGGCVVFVLFVLVSVALFYKASFWKNRFDTYSISTFLVQMAYLFISFRNIMPYLGILVLLSFGINRLKIYFLHSVK